MQNLYQVIKSDDLDEIILSNPNKLIICMFSSKNCPPCSKIKPIFINYSKTHTDTLFIYVDVMFEDKERKYLSHIEVTPMFLFFFNASLILNMKGSNETLLNQLILDTKDKISMEFKRVQEEKQLETQQKIEILKKLSELENTGITLTPNKIFNLETPIEELHQELNLHIKPHNAELEQKQKEVDELKAQLLGLLEKQELIDDPMLKPLQSTEETDTNLSKQDKIKKIQELNRLNHAKQMDQYRKLQQLKQLQKQKEIERERNR